MNARHLVVTLLMAALAAVEAAQAGPAVTPRAATISTSGGVLYVPAGMDYASRHPLIVCVSPSGDAGGAIRPWMAAADRYKWLVYGSAELRNGQDISASVKTLSARIDEIGRSHPVDRKRIVSTGLSGGGMLSHAFCCLRPDLVAGVVVNTGMMHSSYRSMEQSYPRGKFAVFLASPTDFRYKEMKGDDEMLRRLGWKTRWLEFEGGHTMAPPSVYASAAAWLAERFR